MVFQNYALYPHMSVRKNMEYGLKNQGMPRDQIEQRISEAARMLQIERILDRKPRATLGRSAPARRHGPCHRAGAISFPLRRTAVEPRRQTAHPACAPS
jgi:ABC-type taurine transport system ATPase subunit